MPPFMSCPGCLATPGEQRCLGTGRAEEARKGPRLPGSRAQQVPGPQNRSEEETRKIHRGQTDTQEPEGLAGRQATSSVPWTSLPHSLLRQPFCSRAGHSLLRRQYQVTVSTCMGTLTAKIPPPQTDTYDCTHRSLDNQRACPQCSCVALALWGCRLRASDFLSHLLTDFLDSFHISSARFGKRQTN